MKFTSTALILAALTTSTMAMAHDRDESYGMESATQLRVQALVTKHEQPISVQSQGKKKDREESYGMNYATQLRVQALS
ncbi:hypothetical protein [Photobacterium damselae]|nr:hypothetical protein [Photobacterium damselae]